MADCPVEATVGERVAVVETWGPIRKLIVFGPCPCLDKNIRTAYEPEYHALTRQILWHDPRTIETCPQTSDCPGCG